MISAVGACSKCGKKLSITSPGLKCSRCGTYLHGRCMVPAINSKKMGNYNDNYECVSCIKKSKDIERTQINQAKDIEDNLSIIREVRKIISLIEDALNIMSNKCEKLTNSAIETKKDNLELRKRIYLHELHGRKLPKNFDEWRKQRKLIGVKDSHKIKKFDIYKKDLESKDALKKVEKLESYVQKVHRWKKKPKPKQAYSKGSKDAMVLPKKIIKTDKEKLAVWMQANFTSLTEGWILLLIVSILLIVYTFFGALLFWIVEGRYEEQLINEIIEARHNLFPIPYPPDGNVSKDLDGYYDYMAEKFTINSKLLIRENDEINWSFFGAMYFCGTTYTTIGYGDIAPVTNTGKILTIFYSLFGIPLFLTLLALLGKNFSYLIRSCSTCCQKTKSPEDNFDDEKSVVPLWSLLLIDLIYFTFGAVLFMISENWNYLDSSYFTVITMLTIGFGDYVINSRTFMIVCVAYVIVGLAITSMIISLMLDKLKNKFNIASKKLGEAADSYYSDAEDKDDRR